MIHKIHIPVMGICYTADTPIRVAHLGLTSVISLVDDGLLEEYRMAYGERLGVDVGSPQTTRIGRIRAYLDFVADEVARKFEWICGMRLARCVGAGAVPCSGATRVELNEKDRYFLMLPADSPLCAEYDLVCSKRGLARVAAEAALTAKMEPGEIQANIMVNLNHEEAALDAVRGFAASKVRGSLVLSAGVNLGVFEEIAKHGEFYRYAAESRMGSVAGSQREAATASEVLPRDAASLSENETTLQMVYVAGVQRENATESRIGTVVASQSETVLRMPLGTASLKETVAELRSETVAESRMGDVAAPQKKIILKVSDYRSALIQSRYLAKKGLEVYEYRIESGVNCGGHAFLEAKKLMPDVLREFVAKKSELFATTSDMIAKFSQSAAGRAVAESLLTRKAARDVAEKAAVKISAMGMLAKIVPPNAPARITAQGGLCTAEDVDAALALGADGVGVGTPFLLVPQATSADDETRRLLATATSADVQLSHASPLGIPFMNLRTSSAAELCRKKIAAYFENRILKGTAKFATENAEVSTAAIAVATSSTASVVGNSAAAVATDSAAATATVATAADLSNTASDDVKPGFSCRQHYLCRSIPGFDHPVCMASREYVLHRLAEIDCEETAALNAMRSSAAVNDDISRTMIKTPPDVSAASCAIANIDKFAATSVKSALTSSADAFAEENVVREKFNALRRETLSRECICRFLGNAGREEIRKRRPSLRYESKDVAAARGLCETHRREPVSVCPGPNIAYFNREYTLLEMMQHLYGTGPRLIPANAPRAFELEARLLKTLVV